MLATVERLRLKEGYTGYIHLKLIPGASFEYIERAVELADRVSLNLEAPNQARLTDLAPDKEFAGNMWGRMAWAAELMKRARQEGRQAARSLTTQFVVGAVGESDRELLETVQRAHRELGLWRAYFSALSTRSSAHHLLTHLLKTRPAHSALPIRFHDPRLWLQLRRTAV